MSYGPCPECGANNWTLEIYPSQAPSSVRRCNMCGAGFVRPEPWWRSEGCSALVLLYLLIGLLLVIGVSLGC